MSLILNHNYRFRSGLRDHLYSSPTLSSIYKEQLRQVRHLAQGQS